MRPLQLLLVLTLLLTASPARGGELQAGAGYVLVAPVGEMADLFDPVGHGLNIELAYRFERAWLSVGGSLGWTWLGDQRRSPGADGGVGSDSLLLRTDRTATLVDAVVRFQPRFGIVTPYVEGLIGASFFNRTSSLQDRATRSVYISGERHSDIAFNWGAGAGLMIEVFRPALGSTRLAIDLGLRYIGGLETSQLPADAIIQTDGIPNIDQGAAQRQGGLHTLLAHVGILILL